MYIIEYTTSRKEFTYDDQLKYVILIMSGNGK